MPRFKRDVGWASIDLPKTVDIGEKLDLPDVVV